MSRILELDPAVPRNEFFFVPPIRSADTLVVRVAIAFPPRGKWRRESAGPPPGISKAAHSTTAHTTASHALDFNIDASNAAISDAASSVSSSVRWFSPSP